MGDGDAFDFEDKKTKILVWYSFIVSIKTDCKWWQLWCFYDTDHYTDDDDDDTQLITTIWRRLNTDSWTSKQRIGPARSNVNEWTQDLYKGFMLIGQIILWTL